MFEKYFNASNRIYREEHLDHLLPHVKETLTELRDRGYRIGVVTTRQRATAPFALQDNKITYDVLVTSDDVVNRKPDPESVFKACRTLKLEPKHCIFVGDDTVDIKAGKKAGCTTGGITTGKCTRQQLEDSGADFIINDIQEILNIV